VARFPYRLVGFCGVNQFRDYVINEIERCARDLSAARAAAAESPDSEPAEVDDTLSDEPELFEDSLRGRLQRRLAALHR